MTTNSNLCDSVYEYIHEKLLSGEWSAGSRIAEQSIASALGVSRTPVREALQLLDREGVVESVPRFGTIIRTPSAKEIEDLFELRAALETYAAAKAARPPVLEILPQLELLNRNILKIAKELKEKKLSVCTDDMYQRYLAFDMAFHTLLVESIGNDRIRQLLKESRVFTRIFCARRSDDCTADSITVAHRAHERVLKAIAARDPAAAQSAMADHIEYSKDCSLAYYHRKYAKNEQPFESLAMPKDLLRHLKDIR